MSSSDAALVGRVGEQTVLADLLAGAEQGRFGAVVVAGEAGVGKTSLVRAAAEGTGAGVLVLPGTCLPLTSVSVPLLALRSAVRGLPPDERPAFLAAGVEGARLPVAVDEWLTDLARERPVVLVVDDLQWADEETLDALMYVLAGPAERALALLLTVRSGELGPDHPLHRWLADARRLPGFVEVRLGPLGREDVAEVVESLLGGAAHAPLVDEVYRRSGGNPYFVRLLVEGVDPASTSLPGHLPEELSSAALRSWRELSEDARRLTLTLAVGGRPAGGRALARVADIADVADPKPALAEAAGAGILDIGEDGAYWFHHPLLPEVLHDRVAADERRLLHAGFAAGYEADVEDGLDADLAETVSDHYLLAGEVADAYDWALVAADALDAAGDLVGVLRMLRRAVDLHREVPDAVEPLEDLLEDLRLAARELGEWDEELGAVEALLEGVDTELDPLRVAALDAWRAQLRFRLGHGQPVENLERAVALTADHPGTWQRTLVLAEYSRVLLWAGEEERGREVGLEAFRYAEQGPADPGEDVDEWARARAYAYGQRLMLATFAHEEDVDADGLVERAYEFAVPQRDGPGILHATFWHANLLSEYGPEWVAAHERGRRLLEESGAPQASLAWLSAGLSPDLYVTGDVEATVARLRVALGSAGGVTASYLGRLTAAMLAAQQGRAEEAAAHLARADELVPDRLSSPQFHGPTAAATVLLLGGDPEGALAAAFPGMRAPGANFTFCEWLAPLAARALADLARADLDAGRDPQRHRARLASLREEVPHPLLDGDDRTGLYALMIEALDALYEAETARAGLLDDAPARWERAATLLGDAGLPWDEAYACWRAAEALLASGGGEERRRAAALLRRGHAVATRLGARPVLDAVEALARSARIRLDVVRSSDGGRAAAVPSDGVALTPREREVVEHVVAGRTYGEIAAALFLSEKTVSSHISNVLRKTGTANRVELAAWAQRMAQS